MTQRHLTLKPAGLWTDPNPHAEVPEGALKTADDVVIRRKGVIEPRPGFTTAISGWSPPAEQATNLLSFATKILIVDTGNGLRRLDDGTSYSGLTGSVGAVYRASAEDRGSLYVTDNGGPQKLEALTDSATQDMGLPKAMQGLGTSTQHDDNGWFADGGESVSVAYRVVYRREDSNGYVMRSAPSGRMVVSEVSPGATEAYWVSLTLPLPGGLVAGDVVEVYRSIEVSYGDDPPDDLFLCAEKELSAGAISSSTLSVSDWTAEENLGRALYTNDTQQGAVDAKYRPVWCHDLALFRRSLFYANSRSHHFKVVEATSLSQRDGFNVIGEPSPPRVAHFTVGDPDVTLNDDTDTSVDTTGLRVGMFVMESGLSEIGDTGTYVAADTTITALTASGFTMSNNALSSGTTDTIQFAPFLEIDGDKYWGWNGAASTIPNSNGYYQFKAGDGWAESLAYVYNTKHGGGGSLCSAEGPVESQTLLIEADDYQSGALEMRASPGDHLSPPMDETDSIETDQDIRPDRIYWSEPDEPEAVPPGNFVNIGNESAPIWRILPTSDALWVLKEDGVYRLTGSGANSGWRVDPRYPTVRLIAQRAACVLDDRVYMWAQDGIVEFGDTGIRNLSEGVIGDSLQAIQDAMRARQASANDGAFLAANRGDNELIVGVPSSATDAYASELFVLNTKTGAWYRWALSAYDVLEGGRSGDVYMAERDASNYDVNVEGGTETFVPVIEWQARSLKDPAFVKLWGMGSVAFDSMYGIDKVTLDFESDVSTTAASYDAYDPASPITAVKHTDVPIGVPRAHSACTVLYPKVTITQSTSPAWELVGIELDYEPLSIRPRRQL